MPASQKQALAEKLLDIVSTQAVEIVDRRPNQLDGKISLHNAIMSALAMLHLKYPSLLQFEKDRLQPEIEYNLHTLYQVEQVPSDTHMRTMLDPVKTRQLAPLFSSLFHFVQKSGRLKSFQYFKEGYLLPVDGSNYFESSAIHCKECCSKKPDSATPQYYHQVLGCCIVKPGMKEVLPLMPEPIIQQVDASKNDCEVAALQRLLEHIHTDHPKLKLVLNVDDLYSKGPTITLIQSYGYHYIAVAKDSDHKALFETVDELDKHDKVTRYEFTDEKGHRHWFRYVNNVGLNKTYDDLMVNFMEYVEYDEKGKKCYSNSWITSLLIDNSRCMNIMRGGRAKWKIENETFNTLKTQGYNLEHNYGHGKEHLSSNLACLTFLAFLIDQIEQLACPLFKKAWQLCGAKIVLWGKIRNLVITFIADSWTEVLKGVIALRTKDRGRPLRNIRSLIPDTS
ncbi:MAG: hypothetical protein LPH21_19730 [Shewanella sp.]|nr:hypothetical protein [Shewanella sp.]